jgi:L-rhamnose-H+ transport protein
MSSCFAFGLDAGNPIKDLTIAQETPVMWQGLPVLVVLLAGGFTTNFIWCLVLSMQNKSYGEYLRIPARSGTEPMAHPSIENITDAASTEMALEWEHPPRGVSSLAANYGFSALAGATWYMQFFFYTMGETQMGQYRFSSWTLHMASIMIFSTVWGIALKEWRGVSVRTKVLVFFTLLTLVGSTMVVGYGNFQAVHR